MLKEKCNWGQPRGTSGIYRRFLGTEGDPEREAHNATYLSLLLTLADMSEKEKIGQLHCQGPSERHYA